MANHHYPNGPNFFWDLLAKLGEEHGLHHFNHPPPYASRDHSNQNRRSPQPPNPAQMPTPQPEHRAGNPLEEHNNNDHEDGARSIPSHPRRGHHCHSRRGHRGGEGHRRGGGGFGPFPQGQWPFSPFEGPGQRGAEPDFDPMKFIENLGTQLGINLPDITGEQPEEKANVDFVPSADVFNLPDQFLVHVSLPGAQKSDMSIDYDTETTTLCIAGVVHRPGINETLTNALVSDGRAREVGVFEKNIILKAHDASVSIDIEGITAKLADGILAVRLPKVPQAPPTRRIVPVEQGTSDRVTETKGKERSDDAASNSVEVDSETEVGSLLTPGSLSPCVRDAEEEEREYITVDVD